MHPGPGNRPGQGVRRPRTRSLIGVAFMEESRRGQTPQLSHKLAYVRAACRQLCYCCCCTPADLTLPWPCQECKDHTHRTDALGLRVTCLDAPPCTALVPDTVFTLELPIWVLWDASIVPGPIFSFLFSPVEWNDDRIRTVTFHSIPSTFGFMEGGDPRA